MYTIVKLREAPAWLGEAARWFHEKWGIDEAAYRESLEACVKGGAPVPQWYVALEGGAILGGLGVIENDFHDRKDLAPNVCAVYTEEAHRGKGIAGALLETVCQDMAALGVRTLLKVPFLANWPFSRKIIDWFAEKTQKTKTREEVEKGFWGRLVNVVMKRPLAFAMPIVVAMILLVIPIGQLALGGLSEKYLPPDNAVRMAQEEFDKTFPGFRTDPLTLVIKSDNGQPVTDQQIAQVKANAATISGFVTPENDKSKMWAERDGKTNDPSVRVLQNALVNTNDVDQKLNELRALQAPHGLTVMVGGTPALAQDSISTLFEKLPLMSVLLVVTTTILMFLAFGSLVLPIKAALMSALTLG